MYHKPLAFIDVETTGGRGVLDRITEVGIIRIEPTGDRFEYQTLINPERDISPFIESLTGISNEMVQEAPVFEEIASEVFDYLDGAVFVAQNVWFDYRFIEYEFARLGVEWGSEKLCTARLSRRMFPEERRHNLDIIMARNGLSCEARHRAFGDARVLEDFIEHLLTTRGQVPVHDAMDSLCK